MERPEPYLKCFTAKGPVTYFVTRAVGQMLLGESDLDGRHEERLIPRPMAADPEAWDRLFQWMIGYDQK